MRGLYRTLGFDMRVEREFRVWGGAALNGQAVGAFVFLGVSALWLGRRHIAATIRSALSKTGGVDDSDEIMSYRGAYLGLLAASLALVAFMRAMGSPVWLALLLLLGGYCFFIAVTKIAIQCGLGWIDVPIPMPSLIVNTVGTQVMSPAVMASISPNWLWSVPMRMTEMGTVSHGLKVVDQMRLRARKLLLALLLGMVVALAAGSVFHLYYSYHWGGLNFYGWFYRGYAQEPWRYAAEKIAAPHPPRWRALVYIGGGAVVAGVMQLLRHGFVGFPFSVVGYAGSLLPTTRKYWFAMFLVWFIKGRLINYGGVRFYRRVRPFFLGLLLGHALACGWWYLFGIAAYAAGWLDAPHGSVPW